MKPTIPETPERTKLVEDLVGGSFSDVLVKYGIDEDFLAKKLLKELKAKKQIIIKKGKSKKIVIKKEVDWDIRQKARIDAHKLRGDYPAAKQKITINTDDSDPVDLEKYKLVGVTKVE